MFIGIVSKGSLSYGQLGEAKWSTHLQLTLEDFSHHMIFISIAKVAVWSSEGGRVTSSSCTALGIEQPIMRIRFVVSNTGFN